LVTGQGAFPDPWQRGSFAKTCTPSSRSSHPTPYPGVWGGWYEHRQSSRRWSRYHLTRNPAAHGWQRPGQQH